MSIIGIVVIGFIAFAVVMGLVFWYFSRTKGSGKKFPFLLYDTTGRVANKIDAKIRIDPQNKSNRVFVFENNDTKLTMKPPSITIGGIGYRQITIGDRGQYVYLEGIGIDREKYLQTNLISEDIAFLTSSVLENNREFENPMAKTTAALVIGMAVIALLIMIGSIYSVVTLVNNSKEMLAVAKENSKTIATTNQAAETLNLVTEQLTAITAALTGDANLTRRIT